MSKKNQDGILIVEMNIPSAGISKLAIGSCQGKGARPYQEDSFGFSSIDGKIIRQRGFIAVAADGMGGLSESNLISNMLVRQFVEMDFSLDEQMPMRSRFYDCVRRANDTAQGSGGGSTLVAVYCCTKGVYWCSVGDSRLYLYRNGKLFQVTADMDYEQKLFMDVLEGTMTYDEVQEEPQKSALVQYIGMQGQPVPECSVLPFLPNDRDKLLICSDGVYNALSERELISALDNSAQQAADRIQRVIGAKAYANQDNFTAIVLEFLK